VIIGAFTDKGKKREINEDDYYISDFDELGNGYCIIADGMGGHNAGEVASKIAIDVIRDCIDSKYSSDMSEQQIWDILNLSMEKANYAIYQKSMENEKYSGMGTTAIICLIHNKNAYIAHVGDSRAYLMRDGKMIQITTDHSMVEELINNGSITREEAANHPQKNVITRALGCEENIKIDTYTQKYSEKDILLICTDGLTNMLTCDEIIHVISECENIQHGVEKLVSLSNDKGGLDNITVVALGM